MKCFSGASESIRVISGAKVGTLHFSKGSLTHSSAGELSGDAASEVRLDVAGHILHATGDYDELSAAGFVVTLPWCAQIAAPSRSTTPRNSGIFADNVNLRRHLYFGAGYKDHVRDVLAFWALARQGNVNRVAFCLGSIGAETVTAPLAVYRMVSPWRDEVYVFIQHGSYQIVSIPQQPQVESGEVLLYRGLQEASVFRRLAGGTMNTEKRTIWQRYVATQAHVLSDSVRSFNSIHDRAKRAERNGTCPP